MMMQAKPCYATKNIFGPYINATILIPGRQENAKGKEEEKELFEMVDDYIEEA